MLDFSTCKASVTEAVGVGLKAHSPEIPWHTVRIPLWAHSILPVILSKPLRKQRERGCFVLLFSPGEFLPGLSVRFSSHTSVSLPSLLHCSLSKRYPGLGCVPQPESSASQGTFKREHIVGSYSWQQLAGTAWRGWALLHLAPTLKFLPWLISVFFSSFSDIWKLLCFHLYFCWV